MKSTEEKIKEIIDSFKEIGIENTFWNHFNGHYPPDNWESEIDKIPERFRQEYYENGLSFSLDENGDIIPDTNQPDNTDDNFLNDASEEEKDIINQAVWNIAEKLEEEIKEDPAYDLYQQALQQWEKEQSTIF